MNKKERTNAKFHTTWIPQIRAAFLINSLSNCYNGTQSVLLDFHTFPCYRSKYLLISSEGKTNMEGVQRPKLNLFLPG